MKLFNSMLVSAVVAFVGFSAANAAIPTGAEVETKEVVVGINDVYVPGGFDAGSDLFVVVNGLFPNGCYQWERADVDHKDGSKLHEIRSVASVSQGMCIMAMVPFTKEVSLGVLGAGEHTLRFVSGDGTYIEKKVTLE